MNLRRYLLLFSVALIFIGLFCYIRSLFLPSPNYLDSLKVVTAQYLAIQAWIDYSRGLVFLGSLVFVLVLAFPTLSKHKKFIAGSLLLSSAIYFNILYLWTSHGLSAISVNASLAVTYFVIQQGKIFLFFGLPTQSFPVDVTSLILFAAVFLTIWQCSGILRTLQACALLLLPLPLDVLVFDRAEFNLFLISEFSSNPILIHITNANFLYADIGLLLVTTFYGLFRRSSNSTIFFQKS